MSGSNIACAILFGGLLHAPAFGGQKNASYAIVEGTVFRDPGYALADAKVVIESRQGKSKKQEATTNYRGEFQFRVPAIQGVYVVKAPMKGLRAEQKEAAITGGGVAGSERVEVNLVLSPESK